MNARQNQALANTVAESITIQTVEVDDLAVMSLEHAARRHGPVVYDVAKYCNSGTKNSQAHFQKMFEDDMRDAFVCQFTDGFWWVVIEVIGREGDPFVTVFPRFNAKSIQDVINYLIRAGYIQL